MCYAAHVGFFVFVFIIVLLHIIPQVWQKPCLPLFSFHFVLDTGSARQSGLRFLLTVISFFCYSTHISHRRKRKPVCSYVRLECPQSFLSCDHVFHCPVEQLYLSSLCMKSILVTHLGKAGKDPHSHLCNNVQTFFI